MHSSVHYREPKGKGDSLFLCQIEADRGKLIEARGRCGRVDSAPSLLFSYTIPVTLCYNHTKNVCNSQSVVKRRITVCPLQWNRLLISF